MLQYITQGYRTKRLPGNSQWHTDEVTTVHVIQEPRPGIVQDVWEDRGTTYYDVFFSHDDVRTVPERISIVGAGGDAPLLQRLIEGNLDDPVDYDLLFTELDSWTNAYRFMIRLRASQIADSKSNPIRSL